MDRRKFSRIDYAVVAIVLFVVEVLIALFVRDGFVRPYVGDVLAIAFVYAALRAAMPLGPVSAISLTLAIAIAIEVAQALDLLGALGLSGNQVARTVLGGVFDWMDLAAYATGAVIVGVVELALRRLPF